MSKRLRSVGSRAKPSELRCDCCDVVLNEGEALTAFESSVLFVSCIDCALLADSQEASGQMSKSDPFNEFFITPTKSL